MLGSAELSFNVDHGYLEGLVRGCKAGLLTQQDYLNLVQCETLEGELILPRRAVGRAAEGCRGGRIPTQSRVFLQGPDLRVCELGPGDSSSPCSGFSE